MKSYAQITDLIVLAEQVKEISSSIVAHLNSVNHPTTNFSITSPSVPEGDAKYDSLRNILNDAAMDLLLLVNGPKMHARKFVCQVNDLAAYQVALDFDFFNLIPEEGSIHLKMISEKTGIDAGRAGRVLRTLCTQRLFCEVEKDIFAHTSFSVAFIKDPEFKASGDYMLDEMFRAASDTSLSIRNGASTPFVQRHGSPIFEFYGKNPKMAARFAKAMAGVTRMDRQILELKAGFPWEKLGNAKVVDIGGGSGHVSVSLARAFPNLSMTVQDGSLEMLNGAKSLDLLGLESRLTFMHHNFFNQQPVVDADVYFFRQVLHNWDDSSCVKMLKAVVPALEKCKPGTPLLINDTILPEPGTKTRFEEGMTRQVDMLMMVAFGAKQRTEAEFAFLLKSADPRFSIVNVHSQGSMGLLEVHLSQNSS